MEGILKATLLFIAISVLFVNSTLAEVHGKTCAVLFSNNKILDADIIYNNFGIRTEYPKEVLQEAEQHARRGIRSEDLKDRKDLRKAEFITIDGKETIDRDDAISVTYSKGIYTLKVAVPDMAHWVHPSSHTGKWVFEQATSHYLREKVFHMLPRRMVSDVLSIDPQKERLAFVYETKFDPNTQKFFDFNVSRAILKSKRAYTYKEFQEIIETPEIREKHENHIVDLYHHIKKTEQTIRFPFETEFRPVFDKNNEVVNFERPVNLTSNHLIEVFMVAINSQGANFMAKNQIPGIFRGQEEVSEKRVLKLFELAQRLGIKNASIDPALDVSANLQKLLWAFKDYKHPEVIVHALFYVTPNAQNSHFPSLHYFLGKDPYAFLTSPIRRVSDYWNQFMIGQYLANKLHTKETLELLSQQERIIENDNDIMVSAKRAESQWQTLKRIRNSNIEVGLVYNGILSREFAEHDLVYLHEKGLYVKVEKGMAEIPRNPIAESGKHVQVQILDINLEQGEVYSTYLKKRKKRRK